jgi:hypothetical protein
MYRYRYFIFQLACYHSCNSLIFLDIISRWGVEGTTPHWQTKAATNIDADTVIANVHQGSLHKDRHKSFLRNALLALDKL